MNSKELVTRIDELHSSLSRLRTSSSMLQREHKSVLTVRVFADNSCFDIGIERGELVDRVNTKILAKQDELSELNKLNTAMDIIAASYQD